MKVKGKRSGAFKQQTLGLLSLFLLCTCFFLAGLFGSIIIHQDARDYQVRQRVLESADGDKFVTNGEIGVVTDSIQFQVLSWKPRAVYFPNFASAEQCKSIIRKAKSNLTPSTLALRGGETAESTKGVRTSSGTFMKSSDDETGILDFVERKIARATMLPRNHGEAFNILRYEIGQRYVSHYDAFDPAEYGPIKSQRLASFLLYLSDVEEGGETMFPYENGSNMNTGYNYETCIGLKVKPHRGDGLLFYSMFPNGTIDPTSLHGSCPVIRGQKWVATKWIRDEEQAN